MARIRKSLFADRDNLYPKSGSHHISLGRWVPQVSSEDLACTDRSCAPPPVGTGGSNGKGGFAPPTGTPDYSMAAPETVERVSPSARASRSKAALGPSSRSEEAWQAIRAPAGVRAEFAEEYAKLPSNDPKAHAAYRKMATEVEEQFHHMEASGIKAQFVDYDPYPTAASMIADVERGVIKVMRTDITGPHDFFTNQQNDMFRAVHDVYGHAAIGRGFDRHGERAAYLSHRDMFKDPDAVRALATETEGQNATVHVTGRFPEQKIALLPDRLVFNNLVASVRAGWNHVRDWLGR